MHNPFVDFLRWLLLPSAVNMLVAFGLLKLFYGNEFHGAELRHSQEPIRNHELAVLSKISLQIILILVGSRRRWEIVRKIDWHTLIFFASMFVLMASVWDTGFFQDGLQELNVDIHSRKMLIAVSNVIIIQNAERRQRVTITFWEFARIGVPLTMVNGIVYWLFLRYF